MFYYWASNSCFVFTPTSITLSIFVSFSFKKSIETSSCDPLVRFESIRPAQNIAQVRPNQRYLDGLAHTPGVAPLVCTLDSLINSTFFQTLQSALLPISQHNKQELHFAELCKHPC